MKKISYIDDYASWEKEFSFYTKIPIRFSETDMFGHVNNVSPFIYFEQARIEFLTEAGIFDANIKTEHIPVAADLQCDFWQQMFFPDCLKVYVKASTVGNTSIDLHYLGKNNKNEVCFTGRGRLVNVYAKTGKPAPMTDDYKQRLLSFTVSEKN